MGKHNPTFSFFGVLLVHTFMVSLAMATNFTDHSALLAIKTQIQLNPDDQLTKNWTTTTSFCNWVGVSCSLDGQRVTTLNLSNMGLKGTIAPQVGNLSFLLSLDISNNSFHGHLPDELGHLDRLRVINTERNSFTGTIPPSIGNLSNLEILTLARNSLQGNIPKEFGNLLKLQVLLLQHNYLTGSMPSTIFNISSLQLLSVLNNSLLGSIPQDICYRLPKLEVLALRMNKFSGQLPSSLCLCGELQEILLYENEFTGSIPRDIGCLSKLTDLDFSHNNFTGTIPPSMGNITGLEWLYLDSNYLRGGITEELGHLKNLQELFLQSNNLTGTIPQSLFNISTLQILCLYENHLSGKIPSTTGLWLPNLAELNLHHNNISGELPISISNASMLTTLELASNSFSGSVPTTLGNLQFLKFLNLFDNQLTGGLGFLTSLTNCRFLESLILSNNPLNDILPDSIGNLSTSLAYFSAFNCQLMGIIPTGIANLNNLTVLWLSNNNLNGTIPPEIKSLAKLEGFYIFANKIGGSIPDELCSMRHLVELSLAENKLTAAIPNCIGNLKMLQNISLASNFLTSTIPASLWSLTNLLDLNLARNHLRGDLPSEVGSLNALTAIDLSGNQLSGEIPASIGDIQVLGYLNLSQNSIQGHIPEIFGSLINLETIDLSSNGLSGTIPKSLETLRYLKKLNLSFNRLEGEIPSRGAFAYLAAQSFIGNDALCGLPKFHVPACLAKTKSHKLKYILLPLASAIVFVGFLCLFIICRRKKWNLVQILDKSLPGKTPFRVISYWDLLRATNNFCEANLLGVGSFGSVYKGKFSDGTVMAVKVLDLQLDGASNSFDVECRVLRMARHKNLVRIITTCSNFDFRALVLQFMANGSLEKCLYSDNYYLSLLQRLNIMIDVASAMAYLHHGNLEPIVHCDLKPSNVLLDEKIVGHVADFGIAKLMEPTKSTTQTRTLGTIGYIAPEYGSEGIASTRADVYSYGIMLMETFTRKKPTDEIFAETMNLRQWVNRAVSNDLMEVVDVNLLEEVGDLTIKRKCLLSIMKVALLCSRESPEERIDMEDVVVQLEAIEQEFLANTKDP